MGNKIDELLSAIKLGELVHRKDPMEKKRHTIMCVLAIFGAVAAVAAIAYAVYRYMNPDYLEDFDDDFDDYEDDTETAAEEDISSATSEE
jgi:type VI protein secretion system component VasK